MPSENNPVLMQLLAERSQSHKTRKDLFVELEKELGRPVVSFYTSFVHPVVIEDSDVDMIGSLLQMMDLSKGFVLMINSPGGDALAAERMINACRSYSGTGEYWAIIPGQAKSAATMICFGASKILMGATSELGPVDPQMPIGIQERNVRFVSAHHIVESYKNLFNGAENATGNLEPYLQQLSYYDPREMAQIESTIEFSEDLSIKALSSGMMDGIDQEEIRNKIEMFLTPKETKTHGRPIYLSEAEKCGLIVERIETASKLWELAQGLHIRSASFVNREVAK